MRNDNNSSYEKHLLILHVECTLSLAMQILCDIRIKYLHYSILAFSSLLSLIYNYEHFA